MSGERVERIAVLGWREWSNWLGVVIYGDLGGFEKFDRSVVWPNVREVIFNVVD